LRPFAGQRRNSGRLPTAAWAKTRPLFPPFQGQTSSGGGSVARADVRNAYGGTCGRNVHKMASWLPRTKLRLPLAPNAH
jgi:hypothetical protein